MTADATVNTKVQMLDGGDRLSVASGGTLEINAGATMTVGGIDISAVLAELELISAAEMAYLDTALPGIVTASKAAIYSATGFLARSSATLAALGNSQGTAAPVVTELTAVTGADGTVGVVLPTAAADVVSIIINTNAVNGLKVYPATGAQINALGANAAYTVTPGQLAVFVGRSATLWYTAAATDTITGLTSTAAELNTLHQVVAGTAKASSALVLGAQKNVDTLNVALLSVGAAGIEAAVTAHSGGGQAAAFALSATKSFHDVTVVAAGNDSVALPLATGSGNLHLVKNSAAANSLQVFGSGTDTIDGIATGTGVAILAGKARWFIDDGAGTWESLLGA